MKTTAEKEQVVIKDLKRDAEKGDARAQYALSEMQFNDGNKSDALDSLKKPALNGFPIACYIMSTCQMAGLSVPYDAAGARMTLTKVADRVHADAQLLLSQIARSGYGGEQDKKLANDLLIGLVKQDHPITLCGVAMLLHIISANAGNSLAEAELVECEDNLVEKVLNTSKLSSRSGSDLNFNSIE